MNSFYKMCVSYLILLLFFSIPCYGADKNYVLKFNTVASPQQPEVKALNVFAQEVERLSSGKIKIQVFHSGQLGNQQTQLTAVMRGTIDMTFADPNSISRFDKSVGVLGAAYLFKDIDHMYKVMTGQIGQTYFDRIAKKLGVYILDVWYLGTRQLNLRNKAVRTPEEMRDVKLRMPNSPEWIAMVTSLLNY
jgi:TRAP-type C4-dicarboxylate transport system substrate-binding protein